MAADFPEYKDVKPSLLIKHSLDLFHEPGDVFEVRIPKSKYGTIAGYFDDTAKAAALIAKENGKHQAVYVTANPVIPALIARNSNRFEYGTHTTSADADIAKRRWFLLDFDPVRPAGISSTDGEWELAHTKALEVVDWLRSIGWPEPVIASSGNGLHVNYRIDLPNDDDARQAVEFATKMLSMLFTSPEVAVDVTSFNAARVWKVYGTVSAKGSSTDERPHRVAKILKLPKELVLVTREQLDNVARPLREAKVEEWQDMTGEFISDMVKWLADRGQTVVSGPRPMFGNEGQKWIISRCPFNAGHQNPAVGLVSNRPVFRCLHHSCSAYRWKEFREKIDPNFKDPDTVYARLRDWCNSDAQECDQELQQSAGATGRKLDSLLKKLRKECPRPRVAMLEEILKAERRRFTRETIGEHNEKGNIVGLIQKTRAMQAEGIVPPYWIADFDHRIRVGTIGDVEARKAAEADEISLLVQFHSMGEIWVRQTHCAQIIRHIAEEYRTNPLRKHLLSFEWDGVRRLDDWLQTYLGTKDGKYTSAVGRKWMISAVARAMDPGCQADHMLILEGKQGIGKSQALRALGGAFYTEFSGILRGSGTGHKDMVAVILGKMIVEMSELATVRRADIESLKAILTTTVDDVRLSYERDAKSYPRTCVFAGTTNEIGQSYIADITGARRFWPVLVGECKDPDIPALKAVRDQLWAEAVAAYEAGEDWYTVPQTEVKAEQQDRQVTIEQSEPWFDKVKSSLTDPDSYANRLFVPMDEYLDGQPTGGFVIRAGAPHIILGILLGVDTARQTGNDLLRLQKIIRQIGFKKVRPSKGWNGGTYAYDLSQEAADHLWPAVKAAILASRAIGPKEKAER